MIIGGCSPDRQERSMAVDGSVLNEVEETENLGISADRDFHSGSDWM